MVDLSELAPVSGLPGSSCVFIGNETNIDLFNGVLELRHKDIALRTVEEVLLVLVHADEREANTLNVEVVHCGMSEQVVGVQEHGLDCWVVEGAVGVDGQVLVLVPGVAHNQTAGQVICAIGVLNEVGCWYKAVNHLHNQVSSGGSEHNVLGFLELDHYESLTEGDTCGRKSVAEVLIEPEQHLLPYLPLGLLLLRCLQTVEDVTAVSHAVANWNALGLKGEFLTYVSVVTHFLVCLQSELSVEHVVHCVVLVQGVAVYLELHILEYALAWEVAIVYIVCYLLTGVLELAVPADVAHIVELSHDLLRGINCVLLGTVQQCYRRVNLVVGCGYCDGVGGHCGKSTCCTRGLRQRNVCCEV